MNRQFGFLIPNHRKGLRKINGPIYELFDKTASDYIDEILVLSKIAQEYVDKAYHKSSRIVRSGVDVEFFHNASGKEYQRKISGWVTILFCCRSATFKQARVRRIP